MTDADVEKIKRKKHQKPITLKLTISKNEISIVE